MKVIEDYGTIVGKTVKKVHALHLGTQLVITFTDNTYLCLEAIYDTLWIEEAEIYDIDDKLEVGIITQAEYDKIVEDKRKCTEIITRDNELKQLTELKAKYE